MSGFQIALMLAAIDVGAIKVLVVAVIVIVGWVVKLVKMHSEKAPPVSRRPRPPARRRESEVAEEISVFLEENSGRQKPSRRPAAPAARPRPVAQPQRPAATQKGRKKARPGEDLSKRHTPVAENLGAGVTQHLSQHMADRVTHEVEQRMAPRMEAQAIGDLGAPVATSTAALGANSVGRSSAEQFAELLRNPAGMQQAVVMNLILSPRLGRGGARRS